MKISENEFGIIVAYVDDMTLLELLMSSQRQLIA